MGWTIKDMPGQQGRTALVTGANSGLGLATTLALAGAGARVLMACRNPAKAEAAMAEVKSQVPDAQVEVVSLDLSDLDSVAACAQQVSERLEHLDLLINNAGVMAVPLGHTAAGFEIQMGTNHFGHYALTGQLLPLLQAAPSPRIVNVSSMAHRWTPGIDFEDIDWKSRRYRRWQAYGDSKLANLYFSFALQRRLGDSKIQVVAAHPGYSDTNLQYVAAEQKKNPLEKFVMWVGNSLVGQPAEMGALPSLYAATMPEVASGDFIGPDGFQQIRGYPRKVHPRRLAQQTEPADRLWALSEQRTGVSYL